MHQVCFKTIVKMNNFFKYWHTAVKTKISYLSLGQIFQNLRHLLFNSRKKIESHLQDKTHKKEDEILNLQNLCIIIVNISKYFILLSPIKRSDQRLIGRKWQKKYKTLYINSPPLYFLPFLHQWPNPFLSPPFSFWNCIFGLYSSTKSNYSTLGHFGNCKKYDSTCN